MNHIFKTYYNRALGTWVAVPETACVHGKSSTRAGKPRFIRHALAAALFFVAAPGLAAGIIDGSGANSIVINSAANSAQASGANSLAAGVDASAAVTESVAIGKGAKTTGSGSGATAIGINAHSGNQAIAIGTNTNKAVKTIGNHSVAIGNSSNAAGLRAVALGYEAKAEGINTTVVGFNTSAEGHSSVVIGDSAKNKTAQGAMQASQAVVIGTNAKVTHLGGVAMGSVAETGGSYGTALGIGSVNNTDFGVALGALSSTDSKITVNRDGYVPVSTAQASVFNTRANASGISVGGKIAKNKGSEAGEVAYMPTGLNTGSIIRRQVHYVAAGTDDTDAVNVAQLKAAQTHYYSVKSTETGADSNYGNDGATGNNAMAAGPKAKAGTATSIAMGSGANATTATAFA